MHSFHLPSGNLDLITVAGLDAVKLLQGQLTCDVTALPDPGCTRGALCNNKGRVLATFLLVREGGDYHLIFNKGLGDVVALALKKYLPFYKCEFRQVVDHPCSGASDAGALAALGVNGNPLPGGSQCVTITEGWLANAGSAEQPQYLVSTRLPAPANVNVGTSTDWLVLGMKSGQFPFTIDDVEKYTPQELHLDRNGYVSFTKGCYTGQEIVARMHYRGKLKKMLFLLEAPAGNFPCQDFEIQDADGHPLGSTLKVLRAADNLHALALLPAEIESKLPTHVKNEAGLQFELRVF